MALTMIPTTPGISNELLTYIHEHYNERLTLKMLSEKYSYNPTYFSRLFKEYTGMTLTDYIKSYRIKIACDLLEQTNTKVNDIYISVGYSDKTKFFNDFRVTLHTTPLNYRKSKKQILF